MREPAYQLIVQEGMQPAGRWTNLGGEQIEPGLRVPVTTGLTTLRALAGTVRRAVLDRNSVYY